MSSISSYHPAYIAPVYKINKGESRALVSLRASSKNHERAADDMLKPVIQFGEKTYEMRLIERRTRFLTRAKKLMDSVNIVEIINLILKKSPFKSNRTTAEANQVKLDIHEEIQSALLPSLKPEHKKRYEEISGSPTGTLTPSSTSSIYRGLAPSITFSISHMDSPLQRLTRSTEAQERKFDKMSSDPAYELEKLVS